ncbi:E3 ubiquitin-protein ligase [Canna indica]|uniref:E3 ubiquitin-protein ligase n=1 Tax=Canna indica TaxID=4628 RepID=A0AAQ3KE52_9LILI|nr:E3 ubiquitin-protein ligase [Canna indica]
MGFPATYSELMLPRVLLYIALLLGYVRRLICWVFNAAGLGDLLDSDAPWPDSVSHGELDHRHHQPQFRSVSAMLIQEALPVVRYQELAAAAAVGQCVGGSCAVCLYEFKAAEEVRRMSNCRHVFHRGCLDRWLEHDQSTCPLCRTPLLPEEMQESFNEQMWAAAGVPDSYYEDYYSFPFTPSLPPTPTMLLSHQLFSAY